MIIDCHLHLPVMGDGSFHRDAKRTLLSKLDENRVQYGIVIPDNVKNSAIGDLDTVLSLVKNEPRLFCLGVVDLDSDLAGQLEYLEVLFESKRIVGLKIFPGHDPVFPNDPRLGPFYELCSKYKLPVVVHTGENVNDSSASLYSDPKIIAGVARVYPELKIIISHYFWPRVEYCYNATISYNNIYYDTSALADVDIITKTGKMNIRNVLLRTINYDKSRVLYGSDYGSCNMESHKQLIESLNLAEDINDYIFFKNAQRVFNLELL